MFKNRKKATSLFTVGATLTLVFSMLGFSQNRDSSTVPVSNILNLRTDGQRIDLRNEVVSQLPMPLFRCLAVERVDVIPPTRITDAVIKDASILVNTDSDWEEFEKFYDSWLLKNHWTLVKREQLPSDLKHGYGRFACDPSGNLWNFIPPSSEAFGPLEKMKYTISFRKSSALDVVRSAEKLDGEYVGYVASKTYTRFCYEKLLAKKSQYWNDFVELTRTGTPAGRVYGAKLLYATNPIKAKPILKKMLSDTAELQDQYGCCIGRTTVNEEIKTLIERKTIE